MRPAAFLARQWPKRHEALVEECVAADRVLHVNDVLPALSGWHRAIISRWNPPTHPHLILVARMGGPFRRWWFLCQRCGARRDALYMLPGGNPADWRCRQCHGLIYASQRHGPRHPLSRVLTRRQRASRRKAILRQERAWAWRMAKQTQGLAAPDADAEEVAIAMVRELRERIAEQTAAQRAIVERTRAMLAAEAERSRAVLQELAETATSKRVRAQARRSLDRHRQPKAAGGGS